MATILLGLLLCVPVQAKPVNVATIIEWDGRTPWVLPPEEIVTVTTRCISSKGYDEDELSHLHVRRGEGYLHFDKKQIGKAQADFVSALRYNPDNKRAQWRYALTVRKEDPGKAKRIGQKLVDAHPSYAPGHFILGLCKAREDDVEAAIRHLNTAIELDPTLTIAQLELAIIYHGRHAYHKVLPHARAAALSREIVSGNRRTAHKLCGVACFELERYSDAECHYYTAMSLGADDGMYAVLWDVYYMLGHPSHCLTFAEKEIANDANNANSHWRYGLSLAHFGRYEEARKHISKALEVDPNDQRFLGAMAIIQELEGHINESRNTYKRALSKRRQVSSHLIIRYALLLAVCADEGVSDPEYALQIIELIGDQYEVPHAKQTVLAVKSIAQARMGEYDSACATLRQARAIHSEVREDGWEEGLLQRFLERRPYTRSFREPSGKVLFDIKPLEPLPSD